MKLTCRLLLLAALIPFVFSCKKEATNYDRPQDPWVFRSVLDSIPRIATVGLHDDMWVAYNTANCSVYKAWKGSVNFDGAVYTTVHGPQPSSIDAAAHSGSAPAKSAPPSAAVKPFGVQGRTESSP